MGLFFLHANAEVLNTAKQLGILKNKQKYREILPSSQTSVLISSSSSLFKTKRHNWNLRLPYLHYRHFLQERLTVSSDFTVENKMLLSWFLQYSGSVQWQNNSATQHSLCGFKIGWWVSVALWLRGLCTGASLIGYQRTGLQPRLLSILINGLGRNKPMMYKACRWHKVCGDADGDDRTTELPTCWSAWHIWITNLKVRSIIKAKVQEQSTEDSLGGGGFYCEHDGSKHDFGFMAGEHQQWLPTNTLATKADAILGV